MGISGGIPVTGLIIFNYQLCGGMKIRIMEQNLEDDSKETRKRRNIQELFISAVKGIPPNVINRRAP